MKPDVVVSDKVLRVDILRQLEQLSNKSGMPLPKNYKKMKKALLKEELAKMMNASLDCLSGIPTNEPKKEEPTNNKEDLIIQGLYNFGLLTLDVTENISKQPFCKSYTNNYVINGWSNKFRENEMMGNELKSCLREIYNENDWISEYLSVWNRLYMILLLSLMTSVEKEEIIVEKKIDSKVVNV